MSKARNDETSPSILLSLVDNFPCMPQSPAFTHTSILVVLGLGLRPRSYSFPAYQGVRADVGLSSNTLLSLQPLLLLSLLPVKLF